MLHRDPAVRVQARRGTDVDKAIERGLASLKKRQLPSGAFVALEYFEPRTSALHLITLKFIDRVPLVEARATARFIATLQRDDGSFPPYPFAHHGELCATALAWAALGVADLDEQRGVRDRAKRYIDAHGGLDAVLKALFDRGDMTAVYLAMVGLCDPHALPDPHLIFMLLPPAVDEMLKMMNAGVLEGFLFIAGVTRYLREKKNPATPPASWLHHEEAERAAAFIESWLNPNGNNNGTSVQTDQGVATLFAFGRSPESTAIFSALQWFNKLKLWSDDGRQLHLRAFTNENWTTSLALRAMLEAGVSRDDVTVENAIDYLTWSQSKLPMPKVNLRRDHAQRSGGWGFEEDNLILPDTDDTGTVLSALGLALERSGVQPLGDARRQRVQDSVDLALQNLCDMQSDDGGWAGFVWNLGSKGPGPIFNKPMGIPQGIFETIKFFANPPVEVKEPPVEGLTGRVLQGLGHNGYGSDAPEVVAAVRFLEERQCNDGSFWARWLVGYVAATSCVVTGVASCGVDMQTPWVKRAVDWLLKKQNKDGGWGETPEAFEHPERNVISPSMPPLTAMAVCALVDAGLGKSDAVDRAVAYLLAQQDEEGSWGSNEWLQIYEPYSTYYFFEGDAWYRPIEALAKVRKARAKHSRDDAQKRLAPLYARPVPTMAPRTPGTWSQSELRKMRGVADDVADRLIGDIFAHGEENRVSQLMGLFIATDDPIPADLPPAARAYFNDTEALPPWADMKRIEQGQRLFTKYGWLMSAALLTSSLPQAYCAAKGAAVLTQTQGMTRHVYRRVLETAQFLFDVCVEGNFAPGGRAIRAAQKIRLMHATIRHLVLLKGDWATTSDDGSLDKGMGLPINQEDYAGTLMTFSVVLLDAIKRAGFTVSADDEEAYLHLWLVVGHYLGVDESVAPKNVADARALMQAIRDDQWTSSVQGQLLAADLVACISDFLPGQWLDGLPAALIEFFTPAPAPALLGITGQPLLSMFLDAAAVFEGIVDAGTHEDRLSRLVQILARDLMIGLINVQREGKQTAFRIPTQLVRSWTLED